jgi:hypothetical protein
MNRPIVVRLAKLLLIAVFCWYVPLSGAQEQAAAKKSAEQVEKPVNAYRLDFSVNEMEGGKKINTRQYSMNLNANKNNDIRIGTRVPVEMKQGEMEYFNIGTSIRGRVEERENGLLLDVSCGITSLAVQDPPPSRANVPLLRTLEINGTTVTSVGKPTVIGSVDDPDSKRQYQLEVTATKLK